MANLIALSGHVEYKPRILNATFDVNNVSEIKECVCVLCV